MKTIAYTKNIVTPEESQRLAQTSEVHKVSHLRWLAYGFRSFKRAIARQRNDGFVLLRAMLVLCFLASPALAVDLKENSIVTDDVIRLGDIFYGLDYNADADKVLGNAPRPGQDMVLDARTLARVAAATGLSWRPTSIADRITLTREGTVVELETIQATLKDAMHAKGMSGKFNLVFDIREIVLPPEMNPAIEVTGLDIKRSRNWFEATLYAPSRQNPIIKQNITGAIHKLVDVPVLSKTISNGYIISAADITTAELRERDLKGNIILNPEQLIGMTPRRMVSQSNPIKTIDIEAPVIIKRGEIITMNYKSGPLNLTAKGKALESGAKSEMIRVINLGSNKTIEAQIQNTNEVLVTVH